MLLSGRWCVFIFFLVLGEVSFAATPRSRRAKVAKVTAAELAAEQQKAFSLSSGSRAMPTAEWFVTNEYDQPIPDDPMDSRWIGQNKESQDN